MAFTEKSSYKNVMDYENIFTMEVESLFFLCKTLCSFFQLFQKEELRKFLHLLRESAINLLDGGNEPFGYEPLNVYKMDK